MLIKLFTLLIRDIAAGMQHTGHSMNPVPRGHILVSSDRNVEESSVECLGEEQRP